jgi:hypothetical protein
MRLVLPTYCGFKLTYNVKTDGGDDIGGDDDVIDADDDNTDDYNDGDGDDSDDSDDSDDRDDSDNPSLSHPLTFFVSPAPHY